MLQLRRSSNIARLSLGTKLVFSNYATATTQQQHGTACIGHKIYGQVNPGTLLVSVIARRRRLSEQRLRIRLIFAGGREVSRC